MGGKIKKQRDFSGKAVYKNNDIITAMAWHNLCNESKSQSPQIISSYHQKRTHPRYKKQNILLMSTKRNSWFWKHIRSKILMIMKHAWPQLMLSRWPYKTYPNPTFILPPVLNLALSERLNISQKAVGTPNIYKKSDLSKMSPEPNSLSVANEAQRKRLA